MSYKNFGKFPPHFLMVKWKESGLGCYNSKTGASYVFNLGFNKAAILFSINICQKGDIEDVATS